MSLYDAVRSGDRTRALTALRDHLAELLEQAGPANAAPLAKQLSDVLGQLAALSPETERTALDDLSARRAARRAEAAGAESAAGRELSGPGSGRPS